ncbi:hypothetical protein ACG33_07440 [Steroidobacter denitrificans]|uniref:Glycosyl transferase family 1 domain-containing protein n=2 Tax=Steroidobacter denitrificans TaxID=465721 RepID=A0A127FBB6_STEDE|nr:hypothetical protein ACG33_07440 [Steroidobacter denitrificans]
MAALATALLARGWAVTYVAERWMSEERERQGWTVPFLGNLRVVLAPDKSAAEALVAGASLQSIHLCQGMRGNGVVQTVQRALRKRRLRQWIVMETVDDQNWKGIIKRLAYRLLFAWSGRCIEGVLAIGYRTRSWVIARGMPESRVYPFAYFLPNTSSPGLASSSRRSKFRFLYVGQIVQHKGLDLLISALSRLCRDDIELAVVGSGPIESSLCARAESVLPGRVRWIGRLPMPKVVNEMARADCLVLPSRHDGWGAVVSEALITGTPVICSDACGSAEVARASGEGVVFRAHDDQDLCVSLMTMLERWRPDERRRSALMDWARCLDADAGAAYLSKILEHDARIGPPILPWRQR